MKTSDKRRATPFLNVFLITLEAWCFLILPFFAWQSSAAVIRVPDDFSTIQEGIDYAVAGETVLVMPGDYPENLYLSKDLTLTGVVDEWGARPRINPSSGTALLVADGTDFEVSGFIFSDCEVGIRGTAYGMYVTDGRAKIHSNIFTNIRRVGGGFPAYDTQLGGEAIYLGGILNIYNNVIYNNSGGDGTVVLRSDSGTHYFCNNTMSENSSTVASLFMAGPRMYIFNNIIANDTAGAGVNLWDPYGSWTPQIEYNLMFNNHGGNTTGVSISHTVSADPQFVAPGLHDYHIQADSPCVDAGTNVSILTRDFEGDPRGFDGTAETRGDGSDFDIGADEFVGPISFLFSTSEEGWTTGSAAGFSCPQCLCEAGALKIVSQTNTNTFGFWQSPEQSVPIGRGYLYCARFIVSTDITDGSLVPEIRLRANSLNCQQSDYVTIESSGDGAASPMSAGTAYDLYFVPPTNDTYVRLAFDLLNLNPLDAATAECALDSVTVNRFALDTLSTPTVVQDYTFDASTDGWTTGGAPIVFTPPSYSHADGALTLQATTNTNCFGYWQSDPLIIIVEFPVLYRATFDVRTDVTDQTRVPQMRLRFNTANLQASRTLGIESRGDSANSPSTINATYDRLYFLPPANTADSGLILSFDLLNFSPDDAPSGSLTLDRATIETLSPPVLP